MVKKNYALIGEKVEHSISEELHKIILDKAGIKEEYKKLSINKEHLEMELEDLKKQNIKGVNVTIPYKETIIKYLDEISIEAKKIGAVNTIHFDGEKLVGYNSDYYGFGTLMKRKGFEVLNKSVVILGTGGSSKAIKQYLINNGAKEIIFVSRYKKEGVITYKELELLKEKDIVINTTPVGMYPNVDNSPISKECIKKFKMAVDIIYNPLETKFLKDAKACALKYANGLSMLVFQGIKSQELWNDIKFNEEEVEFIYRKLKRDLKF